jgi:hypothetical protein
MKDSQLSTVHLFMYDVQQTMWGPLLSAVQPSVSERNECVPVYSYRNEGSRPL